MSAVSQSAVSPPAVSRLFPTVMHMFNATVARVPKREALVCGSERVTYADYGRAVRGLAIRLRAQLQLDQLPTGERGKQAGEHITLIALCLPNSIEAAIATFAIHAAGAAVMPLNPSYTARELNEMLVDAAPRLLICTPELAPAIGASWMQRWDINVGQGLWRTWLHQDIAANADVAVQVEPPAPDDIAFVQYTGGTTGRSKGVLLSHANIAANIAQRDAVLPVDFAAAERVLCVMPLFHCYAMSMGLHLAVHSGAALVIVPRYRADDVLGIITAERITIFPGSPTIFNGLMAHPQFAAANLASVHTCYSGSAALSVETLKRWESATAAPIYEGYGQTEAGPVLTYQFMGEARIPGSVGRALPNTEIQIVDTDDGTRILADGARGEVRARGPQIMRGYLNRPDETARALRGGWLYTGDIGELDHDGVLIIRDRKKDMIISGGYNIYPREVEDILMQHPMVLDAAVIGKPDDYRGEVVIAFVVTRASIDPSLLAEHCRPQLACYKWPAVIECVDALPKTGANKNDNKALRELS